MENKKPLITFVSISSLGKSIWIELGATVTGCVRLCASVENLNYSDHMRTLVWAFGEASVRGFILLHPAVPSFTPSITGFWS